MPWQAVAPLSLANPLNQNLRTLGPLDVVRILVQESTEPVITLEPIDTVN